MSFRRFAVPVLMGALLVVPPLLLAQAAEAPAQDASQDVHPASVALHHAERLSLTDAQVERLSAFESRWQAEATAARAVLAEHGIEHGHPMMGMGGRMMEARRPMMMRMRAGDRPAMMERMRSGSHQEMHRGMRSGDMEHEVMHRRMHMGEGERPEHGAGMHEGMHGRSPMLERALEMDRERLRSGEPGRDREVLRERMLLRSEAMNPEVREAHATLSRLHREGVREVRDSLTGEQFRELRRLMRDAEG